MFPYDRSFVPDMSVDLFHLARNFRIDNNPAPLEELIGSDCLLTELGEGLRRKGWPKRTPEEIRQELLRINARWSKQRFSNEGARQQNITLPWIWIEESEDEDDIFMTPAVGTKWRAEWDKRLAKKKGKGEASSKGKGKLSSVEA